MCVWLSGSHTSVFKPRVTLVRSHIENRCPKVRWLGAMPAYGDSQFLCFLVSSHEKNKWVDCVGFESEVFFPIGKLGPSSWDILCSNQHFKATFWIIRPSLLKSERLVSCRTSRQFEIRSTQPSSSCTVLLHWRVDEAPFGFSTCHLAAVFTKPVVYSQNTFYRGFEITSLINCSSRMNTIHLCNIRVSLNT